VLDALTQAEMFKGIPLDGLAQLARNGIKRTFSSGTELMRQGDISDAMYVILAGRVRVERTVPQIPQSVVLAEFGSGQVVGEMGLFDHEPRSATVTAIEHTEAVELDDLALAQTVLRYPEVGTALLRLLSERLRSTDELAMELLRRARGDEPLQ
jgi:CRP-like cAMP-binding protein